jgi:hypothetical protein
MLLDCVKIVEYEIIGEGKVGELCLLSKIVFNCAIIV